MLRLFCQQLKRFASANAWAFVVFAFALAVIAITSRGDTLRIAVIFSLHFVADIFVMMMVHEYSRKSFRLGAVCQVLSTGIFLGITTYTGVREGHWQYFSADLIYVLAALKNYRKDVLRRDTPWIGTRSMALLSLAILVGIYVPYGLLREVPQWIQAIGIFLFAIALATTHDEKFRYQLSLVGLHAMVIGSGWELVRTFLQGNVIGLSLSYFLLPATVLIVYLKLWRVYFPRARDESDEVLGPRPT